MTLNASARFENIKRTIEQGKVEKAKAEANLEVYTKQRDEILASLAEHGVTPETLEAEIVRLEMEIENNLTKAEALLRA